MSSFAKRLQRHLAGYKTSRLGVKEAGVFSHRGKEVRLGHILPRDLKWLNILEPFRAEIRQFVESTPHLRLHKYFHHLNSSQAFALNLFYPFFESDASGHLLGALGIQGSVAKWQPELVPDVSEGTNVDVAWQMTGGSWTYCEVKLTESEFGLATGEGRHYTKLSVVYGPVLAAHCAAELLEPRRFFANYQVLRNIWLAVQKPDSSVLFLLPRQNERLWKPVFEVRDGLQAALAKRVHIADIEEVLRKLATDKTLSPKLACYAESLTEKYVLPDAAI